jgi:cob(I)alamin adenosyltransferase
MGMEYRSIEKTHAIIEAMTALDEKISQLNHAIKYGNLNGPSLSLAMDDKREYTREYNRLKLELC